MKATIILLCLIGLLSSCGENKNNRMIELAIKNREASNGTVTNYSVANRKDSGIYVTVDYIAVLNNSTTSAGHIIFGKTMDGLLCPQ